MFFLLNAQNFIDRGLQAVQDGRGLSLTLTGMFVVFSGLLTLCILLYILSPVLEWIKRKMNPPEVLPESEAGEDGKRKEARSVITGEEAAAVTMALILYHKMHMSEQQERLTTQSELKKLSPWSLSGKIHRTSRFIKK